MADHYPGIHRHQHFGIVCSQAPWKSITQERSQCSYKRNLSLLNIIPFPNPQNSAKNINSIKPILRINSSSSNLFSQLSNSFHRNRRANLSVSSSNSSIDAYKQLAIQHIRNYTDSEQEIFSNRSKMKDSINKHKNELEYIEESKYTYASSINMSVIVKSNKKSGNLPKSKKKVIRNSYSLKKIDINYK